MMMNKFATTIFVLSVLGATVASASQLYGMENSYATSHNNNNYNNNNKYNNNNQPRAYPSSLASSSSYRSQQKLAPTPSYSQHQASALPKYAPKSASYRQQPAPVYAAPVALPAQTYATPSYAPAKPAYQEPYYPPSPFAWGYDINDGYGGAQYHKESGDEYGKRTGSYGYVDAHGIYRQVDYVADENGFRAVIKSNEPGVDDKPTSPADVELHHYEPPTNHYANDYKQTSYATAPKPTYSTPTNYSPRQSSYEQSSNYAAASAIAPTIAIAKY